MPLTWHEEGEYLLKAYLKKVKSPKGRMLVLTHYGDILLNSGNPLNIDSTSLGSLLSALEGTAEGLNKILRTKAQVVHLGDSKTGCWLEMSGDGSLLFGWAVKHQAKELKAIQKHLKTRPQSTSRSGAEALGDLDASSVEATLGKEMR